MDPDSEQADRWCLVGQLGCAHQRQPDTIWWRRPGRPIVPSDVDPADWEFVRQETTKFVVGVWQHLPEGTVYVNSPAHAQIADRKPYQLRIAREVGFKIPPTLFSNDPAEIRSAIGGWGGKAIYKPFGSTNNFWLDSDRQRILALFTTIIDERSLPDDSTLSLTPGIYQPLLPKLFELRLTVFGSTVFATKIFSQEQERSQVDWRNGQRFLRYEAIEVMPRLRKLCVSMLRRLGLLMGCFDFVVTPQQDVVFLEVNEGGQFLWLESVSGAPLLDAFTDFLITRRGRSSGCSPERLFAFSMSKRLPPRRWRGMPRLTSPRTGQDRNLPGSRPGRRTRRSRVRKLLAGASLAFSLSPFLAGVAYSQALEGMDVFGVAPESVAELERCFGAAARELVDTAVAGNRSRVLELEEGLERQIKQAGGFDAVDVAVVHYFDPDYRIFLTFNLSQRGERPVEYLPGPQDDVPDPDGLLQAWREYESIGSRIDFGDRPPDSSPSCPPYHCLFGFDHPALQKFADAFNSKVRARQAELVRVLQADRDAGDRASAAFLLAHLPNAREVVSALLPRLRDPDASVRNNIMRVFAYMADHGTAASIPIEPILPFLKSPSLTDRNKAVAIVAAMAADKSHRALLVNRAACDLVRLLEMKQPNQSEFAHSALLKLRGEDLGAPRPEAWREWLKSEGVSCRPEPVLEQGKLCPLSQAPPVPRSNPGEK